jgi:N-acetylglucosaminyldiphosphoundecaprenol N-acetyl-beta-D-mannosaminyltransferase
MSSPTIQAPTAPVTDSQTFNALGIRVDAVQIPDAIARLEGWIRERTGTRYVAVTGMHGVTEALDDTHFRDILRAADLVVPDGMPLVWLGRLHGYPLRRRVYGPELMDTFCKQTGSRYRHFFYGGAEGVPESLAHLLERKYGVQVAGCYSPPFRPLNDEEEKSVAEMVNNSGADVLWVGLSTPKQERWMHAHRNAFHVPVMLGVGAAFDLNLGKLKQAPPWMRENGLEWLFRLLMEPRRLWKRYLVLGPKFVWNASLELAGLRRFS